LRDPFFTWPLLRGRFYVAAFTWPLLRDRFYVTLLTRVLNAELSFEGKFEIPVGKEEKSEKTKQEEKAEERR
jgi:hypothetical protein